MAVLVYETKALWLVVSAKCEQPHCMWCLKSLQTFSVLNQDHNLSLSCQCLNITIKGFNSTVVYRYFDGKQMKYADSEQFTDSLHISIFVIGQIG